MSNDSSDYSTDFADSIVTVAVRDTAAVEWE